ncbi:TPA: hypothetical protein ACMWW0_002886, partial [Legionella pneumophila]|nr:hypothetical protein [Legionella pneumophila]
LWLYLQLKAISNYFKSLLVIDEKEKVKYKNMFDSFVELYKDQNEFLLFNPKKPNFRNVKKEARKSFKQNQMLVMVSNLNRDISLFKFLFQNLGKFLSLTIASIIVLSSLYELGYFYKIGIDLNSLPVSYTDLISIAFKWAPRIILAIFIVFCFEILRRDLEKHPLVILEERIFKLFYLVIVLLLLPTPRNIYYFIGIFIVSIIWINLVNRLFFHPKIILRTPYYIKYLVAYVPLTTIVFLLSGYIQATIEMTSKENLRNILLVNEENLTNVHILRNFTSGILFVDINRDLSFIPASQIKKIIYKTY